MWWLSPAGAALLTVVPTLALAAAFGDSYYRQTWRTPKSLTSSTALLFLAGACVFAIAALLPVLQRNAPRVRQWPGLDAADRRYLDKAARVCFLLTISGYLALAVIGVSRGARPAQFVQALTRQDNFDSPLSRQFQGVAGVSTFTQLGIAFTVVAMLLLVEQRDKAIEWRLATVLTLAVVRTFFLGERLATLELVVPIIAILALRGARSARSGTRNLVRWAPALLGPAVLLAFGAFEYSRSWVYYSKHTHGSFADFTVSRLAGYYVTAYNNGQLALSDGSSQHPLPYGSIEALWTAPVVSQLDLYHRLAQTGDTHDRFATLLAQYGNPEFNSPGGIAVAFVDYGRTGGLIFLAALGLVLGVLYRRFLEADRWAVLVYPALVAGLFELPRYLYFGQGRLAPALVVLLIIASRLGVDRWRRDDPASQTAWSRGRLIAVPGGRPVPD